MIFTALVEHDVLKKKDESDTDNMIDEMFKEYKEETKDAEWVGVSTATTGNGA